MKPNLLIVSVLGFIALSLSGCTEPQQTATTILPPEVAGTWWTQDNDWVINITPQGTISSILLPMGAVELKPNELKKVEMLDGEYSTYKAGDFIVEYVPEDRELYVGIKIEAIHIRFQDERIDGHSYDRFVGTVSEDGKEWTVTWINIFDYGPRFPQDPNETILGPITFVKYEGEGATPLPQ